MAELSGGLRNRVPHREPLFQGWHMNEVPATTEKQNICKNEDFHIGPSGVFTLTAQGWGWGWGVLAMRLSVSDFQPSDSGLRRSLLCVHFNERSYFT